MLMGESVLTIFTPEILLLVVSILVASLFQYGNFQYSVRLSSMSAYYFLGLELAVCVAKGIHCKKFN